MVWVKQKIKQLNNSKRSTLSWNNKKKSSASSAEVISLQQVFSITALHFYYLYVWWLSVKKDLLQIFNSVLEGVRSNTYCNAGQLVLCLIVHLLTIPHCISNTDGSAFQPTDMMRCMSHCVHHVINIYTTKLLNSQIWLVKRCWLMFYNYSKNHRTILRYLL